MSLDTFPRFAELPTELRDMIWEYALPVGPIGPLLFLYKPGSWSSPRIHDHEWEMDDYEFARMFFDSIEISVPLFFVNRQARSRARRWMREYGVYVRYYPDTNSIVTVCLFHRAVDILYVPLENWDDFLDECYSLREGSPRSLWLTEIRTGVTRVAIRMDVLEKNKDALIKIVELFTQVTKIFIVANGHPEEVFARGAERNVQPRWELRKTEHAMRWKTSGEFLREVTRAELWWEESCRADELMVMASERLEEELDKHPSSNWYLRKMLLRVVYAVKSNG